MPMRSLLATSLVLLALGVAAPASGAAFESVAAIRAAAVQFVHARVHHEGQRVSVKAAGPDPRLHLAACDKPLSASLPSGTRIDGRTAVRVGCDGSKSWKIYVPVVISRSAEVLVAAETITRGSTTSPDDVKLARRSLASLAYGWFDSTDKLAGKHFTRTVRPGEVITPAMLAVSNAVHRGQHVVLIAKSAGIQVKMAGKALADAAPGGRVKVENLSSHRIIEGVVRSKNVVEVLP